MSKVVTKAVVYVRPTGDDGADAVKVDAQRWGDLLKSAKVSPDQLVRPDRLNGPLCRLVADVIGGRKADKPLKSLLVAASGRNGVQFVKHSEIDPASLPARLAGDVVFTSPPVFKGGN